MQSRNQVPVVRQSTGSLKSGTPTPWTPDDKRSLATIIGRVFDLQKQFGKTTAQIANIVEGFCWALSPYAPSEVVRGMGEYIRTHADMPTPYDIRQIIDPMPVKFKPNPSYYVKLQQIFKTEGPFGLTLIRGALFTAQ